MQNTIKDDIHDEHFEDWKMEKPCFQKGKLVQLPSKY